METQNKQDKREEMLFGAVLALQECRQNCGNEREALREWEEENGPLNAEERALVWNGLAIAWKASQQAADCVMLSTYQRRKAFKDLA